MARTQYERGPFRADQIRDGDRYEFSHGHPLHAMPRGTGHAEKNLTGGNLVDSDSDVEWAGVAAGVGTVPAQLQAPDLAVGPVPKRDGWLEQAPQLALEYAAQGQDRQEPVTKIEELLAAGTRCIWVVHLTGLPRVVVHTPDEPPRTVDLVLCAGTCEEAVS